LEYTPLRLFATASQPLLPLARADEYRMDLACAASVFVMEIPALSERRSDIRWIAQMLLEQHNQLGQRQFSGFAPDAMTLLEAYPWPGQMEELLRAVKQAAEAASSPTIMGHDLPESIRVWGHVHSRRSTPVTPIVLDHFLEEIQRELIARTLARTRNNRSKAAEMLGISRPRLLRLIEQLGLQTAPAELEDQPDFQERTDDPRDEDG
ncbi:MAG: Transcriptional regulatory protein ZraR, partial [Planctomycetota bacterium]